MKNVNHDINFENIPPVTSNFSYLKFTLIKKVHNCLFP